MTKNERKNEIAVSHRTTATATKENDKIRKAAPIVLQKQNKKNLPTNTPPTHSLTLSPPALAFAIFKTSHTHKKKKTKRGGSHCMTPRPSPHTPHPTLRVPMALGHSASHVPHRPPHHVRRQPAAWPSAHAKDPGGPAIDTATTPIPIALTTPRSRNSMQKKK